MASGGLVVSRERGGHGHAGAARGSGQPDHHMDSQDTDGLEGNNRRAGG